VNYTNWRIKVDKKGLIWIWASGKFQLSSMEISVIQKYLAEYIKPDDDITYIGFKKEEIIIKSKKFFEVYNGS
jgi:hypothetical protein